MAVTAVAGSACTFKISSTAYSAQVTGYTIGGTAARGPVKTLTDKAFTATDTNGTLSVDFVFDEETGLANALYTVLGSDTSLTIENVMGDSKFTGTWYVESFQVTAVADGLATGTASLIGAIPTLADQP